MSVTSLDQAESSLDGQVERMNRTLKETPSNDTITKIISS
jgi:hypothetical protein